MLRIGEPERLWAMPKRFSGRNAMASNYARRMYAAADFACYAKAPTAFLGAFAERWNIEDVLALRDSWFPLLSDDAVFRMVESACWVLDDAAAARSLSDLPRVAGELAAWLDAAPGTGFEADGEAVPVGRGRPRLLGSGVSPAFGRSPKG